MKKRSSGILLHITSLPSPYGIGDLGPEACRFIDFLSRAKQNYWEVLPLHPPQALHGHSPYSSSTAFGGNPLLISPDRLEEEGLLSRSDFTPSPVFPGEKVDYEGTARYKEKLLDTAFARFKERKTEHSFDDFCRAHASWLDDFALFRTLKVHLQGRAWNEWPEELKTRQPGALAAARAQLGESVLKEKFQQYLFFKQWFSLTSYCRRRGVHVIGDLPLYVNYDSADVWAHPGLFNLDGGLQPRCVAGVPPDYFSATGQRWGNPVYDWQALRETGYQWWIARLTHLFALFDVVRIDHFRGLVAYWEIPANEETAINGRWVDVPWEDFFTTLQRHFACLPVIAEDLGMITPDVREVVRRFEFPGMRVLLFAFNEDNPLHPYLPHMYGETSVAYTGTHDTNTVRGWFEEEAGTQEKSRLFRYLGRPGAVPDMHWEFIRLVMASRAYLVMLPLQDVLGLGREARMNCPATSRDNWQWRFHPGQLTPEIRKRLAETTETFGRG